MATVFHPKASYGQFKLVNYTSSSQHVFPRTSRISMGKKKKILRLNAELHSWLLEFYKEHEQSIALSFMSAVL